MYGNDNNDEIIDRSDVMWYNVRIVFVAVAC